MKKIIAIVLGVLVYANGVRAVEDDPDTEAARRHFEAGRDAYGASDYAKACPEFEAALAIKFLPKMLFNLGRCYDRMERWPEALVAYENFIAALPDSPDAGEVRIRIAALKQRVAPATKASSPPTPPAVIAPPPLAPVVMAPPIASNLTTDDRPPPSKALLGATIALAGLSVASAVAGGILWVHVGSEIEQTKLECSGLCEDQKAPLRDQENAARILWAAGSAAAVGAVVTGVFYGVKKSRARSLAITPHVNPNSAGLTVGGSF